MKAMILRKIGGLDENPNPLELVELPQPRPDRDQVLVKVSVCGVCHTELDEIEGRTPPPRLPIILGHQVVGTVAATGDKVSKHRIGDRVGVGWIHHSCGGDDENLSQNFRATGRDVDGGYAEFMTVPEDYAFPIPAVFSDMQAAPLLCAGSIGFRALRLCHISNGQPLGLTGFGGSAHIVIQLAKYLFPDSPVFVFARNEQERSFALSLGAAWTGHAEDCSPMKLRAIIDTTPAWTPVVEAMKNLAPGGRLVVNAIRKQDADKAALLGLDYEKHLWMEREIKSVANITAGDIAGFLPIAASIPIRANIQSYSLAEANLALNELKRGAVLGSKVLRISGDFTNA